MPDRHELQKRINAALQTSPDDRVRSSFSEYADSAIDLTTRLYERAAESAGGAAAVEAALEEFARLAEKEDRLRLQHALIQFVTHHPDAVSLGLRVPDLEERSPWMVRPSRNKE